MEGLSYRISKRDSGKSNCRCCGALVKVVEFIVIRHCGCHNHSQNCFVCARCPEHCVCMVNRKKEKTPRHGE